MILNSQAHNAAIALNNAGALLIQRKMPLEAVATLQDALRVMRYSFAWASNGDLLDTPLPGSVYEEALNAAWKRTSLPKSSEYQSSHCFLEKQIFIVTDNDDPSTIRETLRQTPNSFCAIKIDPLECLIECERMMDRLEIESSIMLYNYAIASICSAERMVESTSFTLQNSIRIMNLALSGSTKLLNEFLSYSDRLMEIPSSLLLVALLVVDTSYRMFPEEQYSEAASGQRIFANTYADDLMVILTAISKREMIFFQEGKGQTSAASAA